MEAGISQQTNPAEGNEMEDTVIRARQERENQGPWEVEVSYRMEADLHRHYAYCQKNPGHHNFVPVDQFNAVHLPPGCRDSDLVDFVRVLSDLTVRVSVKYVSDARPETDPVYGRPYPRYQNRGSNMMRVGSGIVFGVCKHTDKYIRDKTCPCHECRNSLTPKTQFAIIVIHTVAHVVYDSLEAAHTKCHLFFDEGNTPDTCSGVVTLSDMVHAWSHDVRDTCEIRYVTHDLDLVDRLEKMVDNFDKLEQILYERYCRPETEMQRSASPAEDSASALDDLTIMVSHPHGCCKQVTVGRYKGIQKEESNWAPITYTTPTCPGSSGAPMIVLTTQIFFYFVNRLVHCGADRDVNYSTMFYV